MVMDEQEQPELIFERLVHSYRHQGRDDEWIKMRLRNLETRKGLTEDWQNRGVDGKYYGLLTDAIHRSTFDLSTKEHKAYKGLQNRDSLRDNMTDLELMFLTMGETITRELIRKYDAKGYTENYNAASEGGQIAGGSRKRLETKLGLGVISNKFFGK